MHNQTTDKLRAEVAAEWRRRRRMMTRAAFVAHVKEKYGISISIRALHQWAARFGGSGPVDHLGQARHAVQDLLQRIAETQERLQGALLDLDTQLATAANDNAKPSPVPDGPGEGALLPERRAMPPAWMPMP